MAVKPNACIFFYLRGPPKGRGNFGSRDYRMEHGGGGGGGGRNNPRNNSRQVFVNARVSVKLNLANDNYNKIVIPSTYRVTVAEKVL